MHIPRDSDKYIPGIYKTCAMNIFQNIVEDKEYPQVYAKIQVRYPQDMHAP